MEHSKESIKAIMAFRYTEKEAINILNGLNPDGSIKENLPF